VFNTSQPGLRCRVCVRCAVVIRCHHFTSYPLKSAATFVCISVAMMVATGFVATAARQTGRKPPPVSSSSSFFFPPIHHLVLLYIIRGYTNNMSLCRGSSYLSCII
jgi:hypothetical protein